MFGIGGKAKEERQMREQALDSLKTRLERLEERLIADENARNEKTEALFAYFNSQRELGEALSVRLGELRAAANKHDMAIADMLDTWDEWRESNQEETRALRDELTEQYRKEARETARRESALLKALIACQDQLFALRRAARGAGDSVWERQLSLAEESVSGELAAAGLRVISEKGMPVNYDLHDPLAVVETTDETRGMRVADVYSRGYVYRGQVLRKAGVSVFQFTRTKEAEKQDGADVEDLTETESDEEI